MKDPTRARLTDPFATLINLTAAALTAPSLTAADAGTPARPSLLDRLDRWLWTGRQKDLERALTTASDAAEVESRLRARERQLLQRYY